MIVEPPTKRRRKIDWTLKVEQSQASGILQGIGSSTCSHASKVVDEMKASQDTLTRSLLKRMLDDLALQSDQEEDALVEPNDLFSTIGFQSALYGSSAARRPNVALATCTRGCPAPRLREWLFWHLSEGVRVIFLQWEGSCGPEEQEVLSGLCERGEVVMKKKSTRASSAFQAVMCRQISFIHDAIASARGRGCDYLLHLDDDELLYPREDAMLIPDVFNKYNGGTAKCIHFENEEAVFPFEKTSLRPLSRSATRFRQNDLVLYCNGKSAAVLKSPGGVYCSGVHHFCQFDRSFEVANPEYGLHDDYKGCCHPACCITDTSAVVLHFDCPSLAEWRAKFLARSRSKLSKDDEEEMELFLFKKESVQAIRKSTTNERSHERVYRKWRCLNGRPHETFDSEITGAMVANRFRLQVRAARRFAEAKQNVFLRPSASKF